MLQKRLALEDTDMEAWDGIVAVNLRGAFAFARVAMRAMSAYGTGAIVLVTPLAGVARGLPGAEAFAATTAGVHGLTRALARAGGPHGVRANAVAAGYLDTPTSRAWSDEERRGSDGGDAARPGRTPRRRRERRSLARVHRGRVRDRGSAPRRRRSRRMSRGSCSSRFPFCDLSSPEQGGLRACFALIHPSEPLRRTSMFTATKDLMLPATVTGSWPRPRWYTANMWGRPLDTAMMDPWFREQFTDAHAMVISDQERAGLDILTTGDYHLDEDVAGRSWHHYPLQRWKGLEHEELQTRNTRSPLLAYPVGTMLDSIYKTWRWPRVVGKVEHDPKNPLEYAKIWRIGQQSAASGKQIKFGSCSAQVLAFFLDSHTDHYDLDDKMQLTWDMAEAMNLELRQLAASGCKVIQIEEPTLHFMACYYPNETKLLDFLVDCFNREIEGLDDVEVWIHTCWGNPNMQKVFTDESYANSVEIYLERLKGDVWTVEATENDLKELPLFGPYKDSLKKKVAVGVVSHRTLQADFPDVVADRVRRALEYIPADKLVLSTDCGFGRQGFNRHLAFYKACAIPQARNIVLKELGLEPRYIAAQDEGLAWDQLPDDEPFTHLKPLR